jgi:hypothetical protein
LISWKHSFNRLNEEYGITKKKKQALDNLYEKGRISQSTHDSFNNEIAAAIVEIEKQQQDLLEKMQLKTGELENQIKTLEMLLANYEIQYVAGEVDENTYTLEINLLSSGLETSKHELETIKDATNQLCAPIAPAPAAEPIALPVIEVAPALPVENVEVAVAAVEVTPELCIQEPVVPAPIAEEAIVIEQPAVIAAAAEAAPAVAPEPIAPEPVAVIEETVAEQMVVENVEVASEPVLEVPVAVEEEIVVEQAIAETVEVVQPEIVEAELTPIVEEIIPENPSQAPEAAPTEAAAEIVPEVCAETHQASMTSAKEALTIIETSDSSESKNQ